MSDKGPEVVVMSCERSGICPYGKTRHSGFSALGESVRYNCPFVNLSSIFPSDECNENSIPAIKFAKTEKRYSSSQEGKT